MIFTPPNTKNPGPRTELAPSACSVFVRVILPGLDVRWQCTHPLHIETLTAVVMECVKTEHAARQCLDAEENEGREPQRENEHGKH